MMKLVPVLTPHGLLTLVQSLDAAEEAPALALERSVRLEKAFARGSGHGLLVLGADEVGTTLPPTLSYWRKFGARYVTALCALPGISERSKPTVPIPADGEWDTMVAAVPPMTGAEYLTTEVLADLWRGMDSAFDTELAQSKLTVQEFLKRRHPAWNLVGRVHFNLAENRKDEDNPFAFLATYTTRLSAEAKAQHLPLGKALQEYAGARNRERLLSLLTPVQRAAEHCSVAEGHGRCGRDISPAALEPPRGAAIPEGRTRARKRRGHRADAGDLAHEPPASPTGEGNGREQGTVASGDGCAARLPNGGDARRRKPFGRRNQTAAGAFRRVDLDPRQVGRGRSRATEPDTRTIRGHRASCAPIDGLSFGEAMRMLAGAGIDGDGAAGASRRCMERRAWPVPGWPRRSRPCAVLKGSACRSGSLFQATLRPYQQAGVQWLYLLTQLGLGACLADDMGLGKTIQVLSLLLVLKNEASGSASLACSWRRPRCSPTGLRRLRALRRASSVIRRSSISDAAEKLKQPAPTISRVSTWSSRATAIWRACRGSERRRGDWLVLDEAQAIKNPAAKQTRTVKTAAGRRSHRADRHADREPARAICGRSSTSSIPDCWDRQSSFRASSNASPTGRTTPTDRSAIWCAPISCGA